MNRLIKYKIQHFDKDGNCSVKEDPVISEKMVHIICNCKEVAIISCLPGMEKELACGYLLSNGIIQTAKDVLFCEFSEACNAVQIVLNPEVSTQSEAVKKYITSGCGAGLQVISTDDIVPLTGPFTTFSPSAIISASTELQHASQLFRETGGAHSVALCGKNGNIIVRADDIGRHNAFDKIVGYCLLKNEIDVENCFAVCTGRLSSEIVIKAWHLRIPLLVSRSAPTSHGIDLAKKGNVALAAFARGGRFNLYNGKDRISNPATKSMEN